MRLCVILRLNMQSNIRRSLLLLFVFFCVIQCGFLASADFDVAVNGTKLLQSSYNGGEIVRGVINISFSEQANENFSSNFDGGGGLLLDILNASGYRAGVGFFCNPGGCKPSYTASGSGMETATFSLGGGKKLYGFNIISPQNVTVQGIYINFTSDAGESCQNQVSLNLLDDNFIDMFNTKYLASMACPIENPRGCFEEENLVNAIVTSTQYCERITLPPAPAYEIGANLSNRTSLVAPSKFSMKLYRYPVVGNKQPVSGGTCEFELIGSNLMYCTASHSSTQEWDALVCIQTSSGATHQIRMRTAGEEMCGGSGTPGVDLGLGLADYEIYARPLKYAPFENVALPDPNYPINVSSINQYIKNVYNANCSEGCIVPFSFKGNGGVTINRAVIEYRVGGPSGSTLDQHQFVGVASKDVAIDSGYLNLPIEKMNFVTPNQNGTKNFRLFLGDEKVWDADLNVTVTFDFDITPRTAPIGQEVIFVILSDNAVRSSRWDFGDGTAAVESISDHVSHTYAHSGSYNVSVTMTAQSGQVSVRKFKVIAGMAKESAAALLSTYTNSLNAIQSTLNGYSDFEKQSLTKLLNITSLRDAVNAQNKKYNETTTNAGYEAIVAQLLSLRVPLSLETIGQGTTNFDGAYDISNPDYLAEISGSETSSEKEAVRANLFQWMARYYRTKTEFKTFAAQYEDDMVPLGTTYTVTLEPTGETLPEDVGAINFVLPLRQGTFQFGSNYGEKYVSDGSAAYVAMTNPNQKQTFNLFIQGANAPLPTSIGMYVGPSYDLLKPGVTGCTDADCPNWEPKLIDWTVLLIGLAVVLVVVFILYILLQEWYKRNYEKSLFKNPDELYNVINFIYNSRISGMRDSEIKKVLLDRKWHGEQVTFAFRKIDGKRTGMWEIPLFKSSENKKVHRELQRLNPGRPVDTRFIKRRYPY